MVMVCTCLHAGNRLFHGGSLLPSLLLLSSVRARFCLTHFPYPLSLSLQLTVPITSVDIQPGSLRFATGGEGVFAPIQTLPLRPPHTRSLTTPLPTLLSSKMQTPTCASGRPPLCSMSVWRARLPCVLPSLCVVIMSLVFGVSGGLLQDVALPLQMQMGL